MFCTTAQMLFGSLLSARLSIELNSLGAGRNAGISVLFFVICIFVWLLLTIYRDKHSYLYY